MSKSLAPRRIALRLLVLVQLALLALVAWSVRVHVVLDSQVSPGMVFLVTAMLACTAVAFRATFRGSTGLRGHRFAFMTAEVLCTLLPPLGEYTSGILTTPPSGVITSGLVEAMMGLELLAAGCVAAVAALLAPVLLAPPAESAADSPHENALAVWAVVAAVATLMVTGLYKTSYDEKHTPDFLLEQLLTSYDSVQQRLTAQQLVEARATADPQIRERLFEMVGSAPTDEKVWSAYLLVATDTDDGRAMTALRKMIGGFATLRVVETLAMLGPRAAPALPELLDAVRRPTIDELAAAIQSRTADALGAIGAPAMDAVPSLAAKLRMKDYFGLRIASALAIDQIDPGYAVRCVDGAATVVDALPRPDADVAFKPECTPPAPPPSDSPTAL